MSNNNCIDLKLKHTGRLYLIRHRACLYKVDPPVLLNHQSVWQTRAWLLLALPLLMEHIRLPAGRFTTVPTCGVTITCMCLLPFPFLSDMWLSPPMPRSFPARFHAEEQRPKSPKQNLGLSLEQFDHLLCPQVAHSKMQCCPIGAVQQGRIHSTQYIWTQHSLLISMELNWLTPAFSLPKVQKAFLIIARLKSKVKPWSSQICSITTELGTASTSAFCTAFQGKLPCTRHSTIQ